MKSRIFALTTAAAFLTFAVFNSNSAYAASAIGTARQVVITALSITNLTDLDFGSAPQGDPAKTVATSDSTSAQFAVAGEPNLGYTISLPSSTIMALGAGGTADTEILVNAFTSNPSVTGTLDGTGSQTLKVGASRAALSSTQSPGNYSGTFTVSVIY